MAFWGGVFAGALGLSELDEPLRGWVERTAEQAGVSGVAGTARQTSRIAAQRRLIRPAACPAGPGLTFKPADHSLRTRALTLAPPTQVPLPASLARSSGGGRGPASGGGGAATSGSSAPSQTAAQSASGSGDD